MSILILSRSENVHADMVSEYCAQHASVHRVNFDFDALSPENLPLVTIGNAVPDEMPRAVFVHHPRVSYRNEWFADEIERKLFLASWDSVKEWMEAKYHRALWVNRPSANYNTKNVLQQLRRAEYLGLNTPETLFTNDIEKLKHFAGDSRLAIKQGNLGVHIEKKRILTSLVDINEIEQAILQGCPCLFQKYTEKQYELRVHVISDNVLTCRIDSQASKKTSIDWRNYDLDNTPHEPYELTNEVSNKCVELVKQLGLEFGIIDMIVSPEGEYIFLECNAQGHWAWIEDMTHLPITQTLCDHLIRGSA